MDTSELQRLKQRYNIVGNCDALNRALDVAKQVASTDLSVLIVGESGVGKEIIPRLIHDNSPRKHEKYFAINCGSIPEGTIDSELFGHEKGSFTGAIGESEGYFGTANKGTIFLDEVGELPMATQARLLRVLDRRKSRFRQVFRVRILLRMFSSVMFAGTSFIARPLVARAMRSDSFTIIFMPLAPSPMQVSAYSFSPLYV